MAAQPITGLESDVIQHAMCHPITGLGSDAIPECNAVKTLPIKESAEAHKRQEDSLAYSYW